MNKHQPHFGLCKAPKHPRSITSWLSWGIAKMTGGEYSHVVCHISDEPQTIIAHAFWFTRLEFIKTLLIKSSYSGIDWYHINLPKYDHNKAIDWWADNQFKPYDFKLFYGIAKYFLCLPFGKKVDMSRYDTKNAYICHESECMSMVSGGVNAKLVEHVNSPNDFARLPFVQRLR